MVETLADIQPAQDAYRQPEEGVVRQGKSTIKAPTKYRLTLLFAVTALVAITAAAIIVNNVIGNLAEERLIKLTEDNTTRTAENLQAILRSQQTMITPGTDGSAAIGGALNSRPLTLEMLAAPTGLPSQFPMLVEGLDIAKSNLFDTDGIAVWSTEPSEIGGANHESPLFQAAVTGREASKLDWNHDVYHLDGVTRRIDVVETYVPVRESAGGPIIGVMELYRDIGGDAGLLIGGTKSAVRWTTLTTMAGLFLVLVGFVVVADRSNSQAERRLADHALALEASNRELEAFSYSVSHDLRSPLRTIDGFSTALLEDYEDKLDEDGKSALRRVRSGTQRMGVLIDAMLQMSRVSRSEMSRQSVDISEMTRAIAAEFNSAEPERQAQFVIQDGITAYGDGRLIRGVYQNLMANAWKFTSKHPTARIEVGTIPHQGKVAYFVRDDGAGFDMEYADKLFGAFQRLHGMSEFEGTGVGLATAQRIVHRHGGQIWGEGEVEKGATIYFTLASSR